MTVRELIDKLEWENDDGRPILEHARREGLRIDASKAA